MNPEDELQRAVHELRTALTASTESQRELSMTLKELRHEISQTYVRKDVYEAERKSDSKELDEVRADVTSIKGWGVWAIRIIGAVIIVAILGLVITQTGAS